MGNWADNAAREVRVSKPVHVGYRITIGVRWPSEQELAGS
jgi:hypothetical protein